MTNMRTELLKKALFEEKREISLERALLYTESYKLTEGEHTLLRRAKATAHVLNCVEISIRDNELIAGNRTVKPRAGIVSPEMDPYWIEKELDIFESRPQDKFYISEDQKAVYRNELLAFWSDRSMKDFINKQFPEDIKQATGQKIFSVNQTDKGQGHIIPDFELLLDKGIDGLIEHVKTHAQDAENPFYESVEILLKASTQHILRYAQLAREMALQTQDEKRAAELITMAEIREISTQKPETFYEACQLFWYMNIILQYESNASSISIGRFDQYMYPYYMASIELGEDPAFIKELLESLWVKTNDIVLLRSSGSAKFFAGFPSGYTALLGGLTESGRSAVNELSMLCLDAYQSIQLPQPNLGVRVNELIDRPFLNKTAETVRLGTGIPQIFNDEVVVPAFLNRGVSLEDARDYSVVGCVELSIPGKTYGLHDIAMFNILKVMELVLKKHKDDPEVSFELIYNDIKHTIDHYVDLMVKGSNICDIGHRDWAPVPLLSSLVQDCLETGKDITYGGARYNFSGVQGIGIANLSDSLEALKQYVFIEKNCSFSEFVDVLDSNFAGEKGAEIRSKLMSDYDKYGNDIDAVDTMGSEILRHYCKEVEKYDNPRGGKFTPGSYTVSAHIPLGEVVGATPDGRFSGDQLADGGLSPMVGKDQLGPTAVLSSVSKLDNYLLSNGSLLNVKFTPSTLEGSMGIQKLGSFLMAFMKLKLQHIQFNVLNADTLRKAQQKPEDYAGLVVRVAGYSAFFVELSKEIQDDIIQRTAHNL